MVVLTLVGRKQRRTFVHRLVCEVFHGPAPSAAHEVAHHDGDPGNAHFGNLRWATHVENEADKIGHGTITVGERHGMAKLNADQVREIKVSPERGCDLAGRFGITRSAITHIRKGKLWRHLEAA
jgi:hypothetical protein